MSDDDDVARRRALAIAALAASAGERPPGPRPTREEIRRWIDGEAAPGRAAEIDLHTALDPELHAQWRELRLEMLEGRVEAPPGRGLRAAAARAASRLRRRLARPARRRPR